MRRVPRRRRLTTAPAIDVSDVRGPGAVSGFGKIAARRAAGLECPVRLTASQDVMLVPGDGTALFGQRGFPVEVVGVGVQVFHGLRDDNALHVHQGPLPMRSLALTAG